MQVTIYLHNRLYQLEDKLLHHCHLRSSIQHLLRKQFNCLDNTARIAIFYHLRIWMSRNTEIWLADSKIQLNCQENWFSWPDFLLLWEWSDGDETTWRPTSVLYLTTLFWLSRKNPQKWFFLGRQISGDRQWS